MKGSIWVDSEPGEGSTFSFVLPFAPLDRIPEKTLLPSGFRPDEFTVLVVDDNESSRHILRTYLESFRFHVHLCASAAEAFSENMPSSSER